MTCGDRRVDDRERSAGADDLMTDVTMTKRIGGADLMATDRS